MFFSGACSDAGPASLLSAQTDDVTNSRYKWASRIAGSVWGADCRLLCSHAVLSSLPSTFSDPPRCADMAEAFVGTWNLVKSENFDEYMKELGKWARQHACKGRWEQRLLHACENGAKGSFTECSKSPTMRKQKGGGRDGELRWKTNVVWREYRDEGRRWERGMKKEMWLTTWQKCWRMEGPFTNAGIVSMAPFYTHTLWMTLEGCSLSEVIEDDRLVKQQMRQGFLKGCWNECVVTMHWFFFFEQATHGLCDLSSDININSKVLADGCTFPVG